MIRRFLSYANSFIPKDRAAGIDGSRWWGWFKPELATKPIDFIVIKATQDDKWVDTLFDENWIGASKISIRGAYHYQKLLVSWLAQAEHFLRQAGKYDFHIYALDVEKIGNESAFTNREHGDMFVSDMRRIIDYWRIKAPTKSVWLYTNTDIYQTLIYPTIKRLYGAEGLQWLANVPLWLAVYNGLGPHGEPNLPAGRETWEVWQYSDRGRKEDYGTNGAVDLNAYKGTKAEMLAWLGLTEEPDPNPPTGEPMPTLFGEVIATELNIRPIANTSLASIGKLKHFDLIEADAEFNGWWRLTSIKRGGQPIPLPGPVCYAYEGMTNGYIRDLSGSTPGPIPAPGLPVLNVTVSGEGYVTQVIELRPRA